ncbi:hypothetical protein FQN60_005952, partial [Etheostoma spectabile]
MKTIIHFLSRMLKEKYAYMGYGCSKLPSLAAVSGCHGANQPFCQLVKVLATCWRHKPPSYTGRRREQ